MNPPSLPNRSLSMPPDELRPATDEGRPFFSGEAGWTSDAAAHRNSAHKQLWCRFVLAVQCEVVSPFQGEQGQPVETEGCENVSLIRTQEGGAIRPTLVIGQADGCAA